MSKHLRRCGRSPSPQRPYAVILSVIGSKSGRTPLDTLTTELVRRRNGWTRKPLQVLGLIVFGRVCLFVVAAVLSGSCGRGYCDRVEWCSCPPVGRGRCNSKIAKTAPRGDLHVSLPRDPCKCTLREPTHHTFPGIGSLLFQVCLIATRGTTVRGADGTMMATRVGRQRRRGRSTQASGGPHKPIRLTFRRPSGRRSR